MVIIINAYFQRINIVDVIVNKNAPIKYAVKDITADTGEDFSNDPSNNIIKLQTILDLSNVGNITRKENLFRGILVLVVFSP